ncbi:3-deoxy-D-manno-octulosonic acid transferase [Flavobacterium noncentrifugens]|uniref:3-deoxy-D-manno-octulosonic acid transferase n=1 Tax=Flavobacterium noncentrifugens TaxID=1128970 RepID=A0A1G8RRD7_9FLAO|nr:glycosyltransferase N-terminal domain-containing protein [Flavobacterium noncentrifugens]GEP49548.1 3-deoxy-D-manno-octulosonic acid transferase [Flavobacterium noncentrifugens]SDJ19526.1 3-deoxy-D-manno-octulosonic-acid transferase [Flavobacterium noncentrifugens]
MFFLYNLLVAFAGFALKIIAVFSPKMKLFVDGRRNVFSEISAKIKPSDKTIWFHAASLGEYEQGLPVIEKIKERFPNHKIVLTFFSPSGFEVRKNNAVADVTVYLPLDSKSNAAKFIELVHPDLVFFIKYEYWPNYLNALKKANIKTYLISGIFRENQMFFKWYGGFYRKALDAFNHFFVQNSKSKELLLKLGKANVTISGDTRFDRVAAILEKDNALGFISEFKKEKLAVVVGSSWPKDENLLVNYINSTNHDLKFIIAPHNIKGEQIQQLKNSIYKKTVLFSEKEGKDLSEFDVFIIDTIGILAKIYSYADIAYVGGGFGNPGVHNILEPATFGVPIVIGPNYSHFAEATALVNIEGCISISNQSQLDEAFDNLIQNEDEREEKGHICSTFVQMNKNATEIILKQIPQYGDV